MAALCMGAALLATVWSTDRGVRDASSMLVRGQSTVLLEHLRAQLAPAGDDRAQVDLNAALVAMAPEGLRWIALMDEEGRIERQAGTPAGPSTPERLLAQAVGVPQELGERARVVLRRPDRRTAAAPQGPRRGPLPLAFEFEPTAARQLLASGRRTLLLGAFAAGALLAIAIGIGRWFLKRERVERQLEQERRLAGLGQMSAVLAHEIRNPLASLKGHAQLLERALPQGDRLRSKAELLVSEALRLELLVNDLLDFAKAGELQIGDVDPRALARDAAAGLPSGAVELRTLDAPSSWPLDATRMRQVLLNLLENAQQASDQPVTASVARDGDALLFEVCDRGPGFKPEDLPRLFEPFFTRRTRGTGLGLAICKRLVELHGGSISASNLEQGGARFIVRIPKESR